MNKKAQKDVSPVIYSPGKPTTPKYILDLLNPDLHLEVSHEHKGSILILDSYDWRLTRKHLELLCELSDKKQNLLLRDTLNGQLLASAETITLPHDLKSLPPGRLKNMVRKAINSRSMLPACKLDTHITEYIIRNEKQKPMARMQLFSPGKCKLRDHETFQTTMLMQFMPIKGHEGRLRQVREHIEDNSDLLAHECCLGEYFALYTQHPLYVYFSLPRIQIDPELHTDQAIKSLLKHFFSVMEHNEAGIHGDVDSECLHDFRTSIRRSRSLIRSFKKIFPEDFYQYAKGEFEWISSKTSDARDIDVQLESFSLYEEMLPAYLHSGLRPLKSYLHSTRKHEYQLIKRTLKSKRYAEFRNKWLEYLQSDSAAHTEFSKKPILIVANRKIWKSYESVIRSGNKIDEFSEDEMLHTLRKLCKRLRYLLESFQTVYPEQEIRKNIRRLKHLQNYLGEYQDFSVQVNALDKYIPELATNENEQHMCIESINELKRIIQERKRYMRIEFPEVFASFSSEKNKKAFKASFGKIH